MSYLKVLMLVLAYGSAAAQHSMGVDSLRKKVAVLYYDRLVPFDYVPSMEMFRAVGAYTEFSVFSVGERKDSLITMFGDPLKVQYTFADCPKVDLLIIGGGDWVNINKHPATLDFIRNQYMKGAIIYSVCTGAYVLAKMGLLDGIPSTSIHMQLDILRRLAPKTIVVVDKPYVDAGQIVTAAGAGAAIEAALHLIERICGKEKAAWIAKSYADYPHWK